MDFCSMLFSRASKQREQRSAITKVQDSSHVFGAAEEIFCVGSWLALEYPSFCQRNKQEIVAPGAPRLHRGLIMDVGFNLQRA